MVWTILSGTPYLVPFPSAHSVMPGGLILAAIYYFGAGLTGVVLGNFVPMGQTVSCLGETAVWV